MKRKTEIITLRTGKTPLLACPSWLIESITPELWKGHLKNKYFKVSVEGDAIVYRPIYFAVAHGCKVCDAGEGKTGGFIE